jgi:hypothetical protein
MICDATFEGIIGSASGPQRIAVKMPHKRCLTALLAVAALALFSIIDPALAENPEVGVRRSLQRTEFSDKEIIEGFFKIAFGAELQMGRRSERVRKFDKPVRVLIVDQGQANRRAELAAVIADIRAHVDHLDLRITEDPKSANLVVFLVRDDDLNRTIRDVFGKDKARKIQQTLTPQCLSGFGKDTRYRILQAAVILPVDAGDFTFLDCAYEELLQALGPINDDASIPWTMFNDDVQMGFFDLYDQYLLNILYDARIRPGMTKQEVEAVLPEILPTVRAWVSNFQEAGRSKLSRAD